MVQRGYPGGCGTPPYHAPVVRMPEYSKVTSGASVNRFTASATAVATPKLSQSVWSKNGPRRCATGRDGGVWISVPSGSIGGSETSFMTSAARTHMVLHSNDTAHCD